MRVLVIDDEQVFLETLVARLKLRGIDAHGCLDAREGIALIKSQEFDAAILDVSMPDMDGIQALEIIKNEKPGLPVILLTGHASLASAETGKKAGAFDYLLKPFPLDDLLDRLEEAQRD
jgi:two-component system, OmpR family, response regulator